MTTAAGLRRLLLPSYPKYGASPVCQDWWVGRSHIDHRSTESDFHYDRERSVTPVTSEVSARFNGFPLLRTLCQMDSIQMFPSPWSRAWVELTVTSHECVVGLFCFSVTHTHVRTHSRGAWVTGDGSHASLAHHPEVWRAPGSTWWSKTEEIPKVRSTSPLWDGQRKYLYAVCVDHVIKLTRVLTSQFEPVRILILNVHAWP